MPEGFDYSLDYKNLDLREEPHLYRVEEQDHPYSYGMRTCSIDGCERLHKAKGYCGAHYFRLREHGDPLAGGPEREKNGPSCAVKGCETTPRAFRLCNKHYEKFVRYGDAEYGRTHTPRYEGKRIVTKRDGYVFIYLPNHPSAYRSSGYVPEHRLVMERILGRRLKGRETVHHKNGIKTDNRPENLELWIKSHVPGQRAIDLIAWARRIIDECAEEEHKLR